MPAAGTAEIKAKGDNTEIMEVCVSYLKRTVYEKVSFRRTPASNMAVIIPQSRKLKEETQKLSNGVRQLCSIRTHNHFSTLTSSWG